MRVPPIIASLRFTTGLLTTLTIWFAAFTPLVRLGGGRKIIKAMNHGMIIDWLRQESAASMPMKLWFAGLCLLMGLLALNLITCTWRRFLPTLHDSSKKWLIFLIHLVFGLLVLCHGAGFFWGWRPSPIVAHSGETVALTNGRQLAIDHITFNDDPAILAKPRRQWTYHDFDYRHNSVQIHLVQNSTMIAAGRVATYEPLRHGSLQVTLLGFTTPGQGSQTPGVHLRITQAPLARPTIWLFHLMILLTFSYCIVTWRLAATDRRPTHKITENKEE